MFGAICVGSKSEVGSKDSTIDALSLHTILIVICFFFYRRDLLTWFVGIQLQEYAHLFDENQDYAWLDKIDRRYTWIKKHLLDFEVKFGTIFPPDWEISERIAVQFCNVTREDLAKLMQKRHVEIDVKLLLYAIQRTTSFESLLAKRFSGVTLEGSIPSAIKAPVANVQGDTAVSTNPFEEGSNEKVIKKDYVCTNGVQQSTKFSKS